MGKEGRGRGRGRERKVDGLDVLRGGLGGWEEGMDGSMGEGV